MVARTDDEQQAMVTDTFILEPDSYRALPRPNAA